jgi:hypothetical protein
MLAHSDIIKAISLVCELAMAGAKNFYQVSNNQFQPQQHFMSEVTKFFNWSQSAAHKYLIDKPLVILCPI